MSVYDFLASDIPFEMVKNEKVLYCSVREARERGIPLPDVVKYVKDIDKKNVVCYVESEEDWDEMTIEKDRQEEDTAMHTNKKYRAAVDWEFTEQRGMEMLTYIKRHLETAEEVELWHIWLGEQEIVKKRIYMLSELTIRELEEIWGNHVFSHPMCFVIQKEKEQMKKPVLQ